MPSLAFRHTIRARLALLVVTSVAVASVTVGSLSLWQAAARYGAQKRETLFSTAHVLASSAARGVAENDGGAIHEAIRAIGRIDTITYVAVSDAAGRHLADLGATEQLVGDLVLDEARADLSVLDIVASRSVELSVPVVRAGARVGELTLLATTADLPPRLWGALVSTLAGSLVALILGLAVALRMQASITGPLAALSGAMKNVRDRHDYSVNVAAAEKGEIGLLTNGFNAMLQDIRERDGRLAAHREHLEQEVAERTVDLVAARDAAEDANAQKSQFLATMSHEIRTPMNGMLVMAELLASSDLPARARRYAEVVARSGQSLLAIINDILDFSKIEAGKLELETLAVDPAECAETVVSLFHERARSKGLDLAARVDLDVPARIEADPVRLGQVLGNLVNNALKFNEKGGVELRISRDPARAGAIRFAVVDTGIGIPADKIASVFEVFSQADQSTTRRYGGTGLGLAICQRLVGAMGGEIGATSEVGKGSTFAFSLDCADAGAPAASPAPRCEGRAILAMRAPVSAGVLACYLRESGLDAVVMEAPAAADIAGARLVIADADILETSALARSSRSPFVVALAEIGESAADRCLARGLADMTLAAPVARGEFLSLLASLAKGEAPARAAQQVVAAARQDFAGARVLVADDSPVNREVAIEALGRFGVTPDVVEDGLRAVEACDARAYDLVLMDGSMPGLDGFEATRRIRAAEAGGRRTPVVALTAHVIGAGADLWKEVGMDGVLHKPFSIAKLGEILAAHLAPRAEEPTAAPADADAGANPVIDPEALGNLRGQQSPDFARRVIGLYASHAPKSATAIASAFEAGDLSALGAAAHALKSMSLTIGAARVAASASEIERVARAEQRLPEPALVLGLAGDIARACAALEEAREAA